VVIAQFYKENFKKLVNFIKDYAGEYELAQDVVQEVFLRLLEMEQKGKTHFIQNDKVNFFFVYRACVNLCIKLADQKRKYVKVRFDDIIEMDDWLAQPEEQYSYEEDERWEQLVGTLNNEIEALRWYDREVLKLSLEYSVSAIARGTTISRDSLRNTLKIAKDELRDRTEDNYQAWKEAEGNGRCD